MSLTADQKLLRRSGIGSSQIGIVAGLSPYGSRLDVYRSIVEGWQPEESDAMSFGTFAEPYIADRYAKEMGATLTEVGTVRHAIHKIALATPDRLVSMNDGTGGRVLECKTANLRQIAEWGASGTDEVPAHYLAQTAWQMFVTGLPLADLAVLLGGDEFRIYHLKRDRELEAMLLEAAQKFWVDHVEPRRPPAPDGTDSYSAWIAERFPRSTRPSLQADAQMEHLAQTYIETSAELKKLGFQRRAARQQLETMLGEAEGAIGSGWKLTWRTGKGKPVTDWKAICEEVGVPKAVIQKHTTRTPTRSFRITTSSRLGAAIPFEDGEEAA